MGLLNKEAFFAAQDAKFEDVPVPQLGGSIRIRVMAGDARDAFNDFMRSSGEQKHAPSAVAAALLVHTCVDESGEPMFTMEDLGRLRAKSGPMLDFMMHEAMRINALGQKADDEAEKNSVSNQSDDSGTASPSPSESQ